MHRDHLEKQLSDTILALVRALENGKPPIHEEADLDNMRTVLTSCVAVIAVGIATNHTKMFGDRISDEELATHLRAVGASATEAALAWILRARPKMHAEEDQRTKEAHAHVNHVLGQSSLEPLVGKRVRAVAVYAGDGEDPKCVVEGLLEYHYPFFCVNHLAIDPTKKVEVIE